MTPRPNLIEAIDGPFQPWFKGESWNGWRSVIKAVSTLPMTADDVQFWAEVAGGRKPPTKRPREIWIAAGRRSGKDSVASAAAAHAAAFFDRQDLLRPGERALVAIVACDRDQSRICLNYTKAFFETGPLRGLVERETEDGLWLANRVDISVQTNNFRAPRGRPILMGILDEVAFFRDENSSTPDVELYRWRCMAPRGGRVMT
jgi:hypothetical protein